MPSTEDHQERVIQALKERAAVAPCPRCANNQWVVGEGTVSLSLDPDFGGGIILGGKAIPAAVVVCTKCGFIAHHALGVLGLMPSQEKAEEQPAKESAT